ncbi:SDR family NAD(P)-dependent oxidoreductase [Salinibacterium sp. ZJ450]|uniref:SDR family NAD(P)-dependent oxidoreductase n=1 Tax=Salinibacterium sp. ZJ450 TaxID=2708338 RepID=UPI00142266CC|nr:SDR family oxidoreductase [Salinibacterium sp. ZJ450]
MQDEKRTVIVTGGGSGIGRAIAQRFGRSGDTVYVWDIDESRARSALVDGADMHAEVVDVRDYDRVLSAVKAVQSATSNLDVVVHSAGVFDGYAGIDDTTPELWNRVIELNLTGAFHVARSAGLQMRDAGKGGRIIVVSSIGGVRASLDGLAYVTSKAGLDHMVRRLAFELGRDDITVNAVSPGSITTDLGRTSKEILGDAVKMGGGIRLAMPAEAMKFALPAGRSGTVDEVAALVEFLAGHESAYINGQAIAIDGGWTAG